MGLMSKIAESRIGKAGALVMGAGAVAVPYAMSHPTPVYAEAPIAPGLDQRTQKLLADVDLMKYPGLSDNELLDLYNRFLPKAVEFQKRLQNDLRNYAKSRGLNIDQIAKKDYDSIAGHIEEAMKKNPVIQTVYDLDLVQKVRLAVLLDNYLDKSKIKRENADFYPIDQRPYQKFLDAELTIPVGVKEFVHPVIVRNPRNYRTQVGDIAIELSGDGSGLWANLRDFGPKPGHYARGRIEKELKNLHKIHFWLDGITRAKPYSNPAELEKWLEGAPEEVKYAIANGLGWEGSPALDVVELPHLDLNSANLLKRRREIKDAISILEELINPKRPFAVK